MLRICDRDLRSNEVARNHEVISRMGKGTNHCDAINVFCEGTVTFVGTTFTVVRRASEIAQTVGTNRVRR